jgi:hypothetical protein
MMARLIAWLIDAIVLFLLVRVVLRLVTGGRRVRRSTSGPRARAVERSGGTLVRDPQCGTYVPESGAVALRAGGQTLHFCSTACRDVYQREHVAPAARVG